MSKTIDGERRRLLVAAAAAIAVPPGRVAAAGAERGEIGQHEKVTAADFIERAFALRRQALDNGDQGYGALLVRNGLIVGEAPSRVIVDTDPTAHAEMEAIRDASRRSGSRNLAGCTLYSSSRPCPMCEAAAFWAGVDRMVHGAGAIDAGKPRLC